ncbi:MlaA family lipoprotein [Vibrio breoganii]|uniref:ABC transporter n=1 Tax=Vibrio breoganii TaxID=553239 RepID=A0AAP8MUA5_9VIBR|nr:MlaA family lipoprotein [Vibrio breoganii]PMF81122.1 ABC transporter [Vibrio breoganii]PMH20611.1 ABC transporter [Vibrio breoganii]PML93215.1 ABC transporter [Vibrio breoganii]PMM04349.1 ABC transporter [Vibrio breoganii]PMM18810.1 ABC transporter [Vibrio breoganii]
MSRIWILIVTLMVGCASNPEGDSEGQAVSHPNDPFEGFNRTMWDFNYDILDPYFVRPVSLAYTGYTPGFIRTGISNFLAHLDEPSSVVNNLLMGNGTLAFNHFNRFWINTTFGVAGLYDAAAHGGIAKEDDRAFSDVLGKWGLGSGWYFMFPGYGPYTLREVGDFADGLYPTLSYLNIWASFGKWVFEGMETRSALVAQEELLNNSPDPYALSRDAYLQRRAYKADVADLEAVDEEEEDFLDDYLDEEF